MSPPLAVSTVDFRFARQLIDRATRASTRWLDAGHHHDAHPERFLALHRHADPTRPEVTAA